MDDALFIFDYHEWSYASVFVVVKVSGQSESFDFTTRLMHVLILKKMLPHANIKIQIIKPIFMFLENQFWGKVQLSFCLFFI